MHGKAGLLPVIERQDILADIQPFEWYSAFVGPPL